MALKLTRFQKFFGLPAATVGAAAAAAFGGVRVVGEEGLPHWGKPTSSPVEDCFVAPAVGSPESARAVAPRPEVGSWPARAAQYHRAEVKPHSFEAASNTLLPSLDKRLAELLNVSSLPRCVQPSHAYDVGEVSAWLRSLSTEEGQLLAQSHPDLIGALDGAPARMRDAANKRRIAGELNTLLMQRERANGNPDQAGELDRRIQAVASFLRPDVQVLAWDPRNTGKLAVAIGDLDSAEVVSVLVPGAEFDLSNSPTWLALGFAYDGFLERKAPHTSTIVWMDYDAPQTFRETLHDSRAREGATRLIRFMHGLAANPVLKHKTLMGHSYGSVVMGKAAPKLVVNDVIALGSPGMGVHHASELGLAPGTRVWAAMAERDFVRAAFEWPWQLAPTTRPEGRLPFIFGTDPTSPEFGAAVLEVPAEEMGVPRLIGGHMEYFYSPELLDRLARISTGDHSG